MYFTELSLDGDLLRGIADADFTECTPVQEKTFAETLEKRDVYVQSQTGSGKTAAFLIAIFEHFKRETFDTNRAVVIVPTRELAVQIEAEAKLLGSHLPFRVGSFYGGVGYEHQLRMLEQGCEIVIGTPGRLIDLNQRKKLDFRDSSIVVIDEADRLFDMGFLPDLRKMMKRMPHSEKRLTMLYSATLNTRVWQLAWEYMHEPVQIIMNPENLTVAEVHQELYHVSSSEKFRLLLGILDRENATNILIFTNTKSEAEVVSRRLEYNGYHSRFIIGDLPQKRRIRLIDEMKAGKLQILVATDVAARGLHINDLPLVVNYDLPEDPEGYVHRIGRTARAGKAGKAITLACERFVYSLESIEELIDSKIPTEWHNESLLLEDKSEGQRIVPQRRAARTGAEASRSRSSHGTRTGHSAHSRRQPSRNRQPQTSGRGSRDDSRDRDRPTRTRPDDRDRSQKRPVSHKPNTPRNGSSRPAAANRAKPSGKPSYQGRSSVPVDHGRKSAPSSDATIEERLAHYREKYGEDFVLVDEPSAQKVPSESDKISKPPADTSNAANKPSESSFFSRLFKRRKRNTKNGT